MIMDIVNGTPKSSCGRAIFKILTSPVASSELVRMYLTSESECTRQGRLDAGVGSSRERDMIALLMYYLGASDVTLEPTNGEAWDARVKGTMLSIKHQTGPLRSKGLKILWTADRNCQKAFMATPPKFDYDLLIVNVSFKTNIIEFRYFTQQVLQRVADECHNNRTSVYHICSGNSRGIELATPFIRQIEPDADFCLAYRFPEAQTVRSAITTRLESLSPDPYL